MTAFPLFIGGRFRVGEGRTVEPVVDPATGGGVADPTHAGARELDEAALDRMALKGLKALDREKLPRRRFRGGLVRRGEDARFR